MLALNQVSLLDEGGNTRDDLFLPKGTEDAEKLAVSLCDHFQTGKEIAVTVIKVRKVHFNVLIKESMLLTSGRKLRAIIFMKRRMPKPLNLA